MNRGTDKKPDWIIHDLNVSQIDVGSFSKPLLYDMDDDEDRASDLRVFLESLDSHHSEINGREIFIDAYSEEEASKSVLESLKVLELRGRYNLMRG